VNIGGTTRQDVRGYVDSTVTSMRGSLQQLRGTGAEATIEERIDDVQSFRERLDRTPGGTVQEVQAASTQRSREGWVRSLLGSGVAAGIGVGISLLLAPVAAPALLATAVLLPVATGAVVGSIIADRESTFREDLGNFAEDLSRGVQPGIKTGWRPGASTHADSSDISDPANPASPLHPGSPLNPINHF